MKYQALRPNFSPWVGGGGGVGVVGGLWWGGVVGWGVRLDYLSNQIQILKNCHFGVKKIIVDLMKELKYEHQSTFPLWGRVKLNFRDRYGKPNIYSKNSSHYQGFSSNSQKMTLV